MTNSLPQRLTECWHTTELKEYPNSARFVPKVNGALSAYQSPALTEMSVMNPKLVTLFDKFKSSGLLPSPRGPALAVVKMTQQDDATNEQLVHVIQADPTLVARLLKLANACRVPGSRPVLAVKESITILGLNAVRGLALGFSLMRNPPAQPCSGFNYSAFWSRNLARATAMQALTASSRLMQSDEAFCLGLLSQVGELGLASLFPDDYAQVLSSSPGTGWELLQAERQSFEFDHAELSAALLSDWGFPGNLVDSVRMYEQVKAETLSPGSRSERLLLTLMLAAKIATVCLADVHERRALMANLLLLGGQTSIDANDLMVLCDRVVRDWTDWCRLLAVPSHDLPPFAELMNAPAPPVLKQGSGPSKVTSHSGFRVLIVDDSVVMRDFLKLVLGNAGYVCSEADNGRVGLERALADPPELMIVDWAMPEMDGITLVRKLRASRVGRAIYILLLTGMDKDEKLVEAFAAGVDDFLAKPPKPNVLLSRMLAAQRVVALNQEIKRDQSNLQRFATEFAKINTRLQETQIRDAANQERFAAKQRLDAERSRDFSLSASDWFWETDNNHCFCYFSSNFEKVYGLPPEKLLGKSRKTILELNALNQPELTAAHLAQLAQHVSFRDFEYQIRVNEGDVRWISVSGLPHLDSAGQFAGYRGTGTIVTERKRVEAALRLAMQMAQAANVAKSRFLATMSHEIRTPMNGILGMAQMLLLPELPEVERIDYARTILSSGQTLLMLLNDVLDLSKIESGKLHLENSAFSPAAMMSEICNLFSGAAQAKALHLEFHWRGASDQRYQGDSHRLRQMLANLVGNAIKFTAHGSVQIEAHETQRKGQAAILEFSVCDTGIGISPDKVELLFKPFSQADSSTTREFGGTGLGLSIVRQLALAMGGNVGVKSVPGEGATFWFQIRAQIVADEQDSQCPAQNTHTKTMKHQPLQGHLLVAEDNATNALVIKTFLSSLGITMVLVGDGEQAVDAVLREVPSERADVILMDLHMPLLDGYSATEKIRQWETRNGRPRRPIIALTADAFEEDRRRCLAVGMDDFLTKPVSIEMLKMTLTKWLPETRSVVVD